jgi:hypothetical protein
LSTLEAALKHDETAQAAEKSLGPEKWIRLKPSNEQRIT